MKRDIPNRNTQRGAVLAIGLILLAVATLVTLTAMNTGIMQESMTANQDNNARSFMAAEAGAAELVAEWLDVSSWPTTNVAPALSGIVGGDQSIRYTVNLHAPSTSWTDSPLNVLIEGRALAADNTTLLARTELLIQLERGTPPPPGGPPPANPPAAISCFNGPCNLNAGSGQGANIGWGLVSGFNHPLPPKPCSGAGCRMQPENEDRPMPAVPAVFMSTTTGSGISAGGGHRDAFQGLNRAGTGVVKGRDLNVARRPGDYPDVEGQSTAPTWQSVFGLDENGSVNEPVTQLESGRTSLTALAGSSEEFGTLVVDGEDLTMQGNSLIVGLVVIRNCGTLRMGGNPNVYGAIIIDAVRRNADGSTSSCPANYNPFGSAGTPAVRFSRAPFSAPPGTGTGTGTGGSTGVRIWSERLL